MSCRSSCPPLRTVLVSVADFVLCICTSVWRGEYFLGDQDDGPSPSPRGPPGGGRRRSGPTGRPLAAAQCAQAQGAGQARRRSGPGIPRYLFRRLRHCLACLGVSPRIITASATVASPDSHLRNLFGLEFSLVPQDRDTSPRQQLSIRMTTPPRTSDLLTPAFDSCRPKILLPSQLDAATTRVWAIGRCGRRQNS
jgi:hypothetical protein